MTTHLVFSLVGPDRTGLVERLSEVIVRHGGNLEDARMAVLGGEFAVIMLVAVEEEKRAALEADMRKTGEDLSLMVLCKETQERAETVAGEPMTVKVQGMDHEGIVHPISHVLAGKGISIVDLASEVTAAPVTGTDLFSMTLRILAPSALSVADLRKSLRETADRLNVDIDVEAGHAPADPSADRQGMGQGSRT